MGNDERETLPTQLDVYRPGLELDLATVIGRLNQIEQELETGDGGVNGFAYYLLRYRVIACDAPRLTAWLDLLTSNSAELVERPELDELRAGRGRRARRPIARVFYRLLSGRGNVEDQADELGELDDYEYPRAQWPRQPVRDAYGDDLSQPAARPMMDRRPWEASGQEHFANVAEVVEGLRPHLSLRCRIGGSCPCSGTCDCPGNPHLCEHPCHLADGRPGR